MQSDSEAGLTELDRALAEISEIRSHLARAVDFRGFGPATFAATGVIAAAVAVIQVFWLKDPAANVAAYLALWFGAAAVSGAIIGFEMLSRSRRIHSILADDMVRSAFEQFAPAGVAGLALTAVVVRFLPGLEWMLPGLWQIVFGLGVFASCRFLPRAMWLVGAWYVSAGLFGLAFGGGANALAPWTMGAPFAIGQLMVAAVLRFGAGGGDDAD